MISAFAIREFDSEILISSSEEHIAITYTQKGKMYNDVSTAKLVIQNNTFNLLKIMLLCCLYNKIYHQLNVKVKWYYI